MVCVMLVGYYLTCEFNKTPHETSIVNQAKQKNRGVNEIWADAVSLAAGKASAGTAPKPLCAHLVRMGDLGNVPRQEKKFKVIILARFICDLFLRLCLCT